MNGIDVSSYQADLDVSRVAADFVIVKATQGTTYVNPHCDAHVLQALAANKKLGVYHFADGEDAIAEADWFVNNCQGYIRKAIFILDWEGEGTQYTDWAHRFLAHVESRIGYKPTIYMSEAVENEYDWSAVAAGDYGLWIAKYWDMSIDNNYDMSNAGPEPVTKYWSFYYIWQWTSSGRLDGYGGNLDCNKAYITAPQWDVYAGVHVAPTPAAPVVSPIPIPEQPTPSPAPAAPIVETAPPTPGDAVPVGLRLAQSNQPTVSPLPQEQPSTPSPKSQGFIAAIVRLFKAILAWLNS